MGGARGRRGVTRSVLLDTHAFLWFAAGYPAMPLSAREIVIEAADVYVSAASVWEARTKHRIGKLPIAADLVASGLPTVVAQLGFRPLAVEVEDGDLAGSFSQSHRDPFDRMVVAQAIRRGLALVSNDAALDAFGVTRVW